jgi:hypothetical protein
VKRQNFVTHHAVDRQGHAEKAREEDERGELSAVDVHCSEGLWVFCVTLQAMRGRCFVCGQCLGTPVL